jgi:riboflavin biosynthesis pyrimidine reductase
MIGTRPGVQTTTPATTRPATPAHPADLELLWVSPAGDTKIGVEMRGGIGAGLAHRYGGDLLIPLRPDRPTMIANFVETLDGVVSMDAGRSGGGDVSGFNQADRLVMGLLRALADVVLVGAGTLRGSGVPGRTPALAFPAAAAEFAALRSRLGLAPNPTTLVVSATGDVDPHHPAFGSEAMPIAVAGPAEAMARLRKSGLPAHVRIEPISSRHDIGGEISALAARMGARLVLSEAGPHLMAELVSGGSVDELFLTISPQLAGRDAASRRLSMLEGVSLWPNTPRWLRLRSTRRAGDHVFLRYEFEESSDGR